MARAARLRRARGRAAFTELRPRLLALAPGERLRLITDGEQRRDDYASFVGGLPLLGLLSRAPVGTLMLELATPRAGELEVLAGLPADKRIGVGRVDQKAPRVESVEEVLDRAGRAIQLLGKDCVLLAPDCGFATVIPNSPYAVSTRTLLNTLDSGIAPARHRGCSQGVPHGVGIGSDPGGR